MMALVNELSTQLQNDSELGTLSFFFCQGTDPRLSNTVSVLRCLVYLLVDQQRHLIKYILKRYDTAGSQLFTDVNAWSALSSIFTDTLNGPALGRVYLLVDALDECESGLPQLLKLISACAIRKITQAKWLVSVAIGLVPSNV